MAEYISKESMLKNLTSDLEHHSDKGDPRTHLVMQRFIKYVEDFPAADVQPTERVIEVEQMLGECERKLRYLLECEIESSSERHSITKLLDKIQVRYTKDGDTK